MKKYRLISLIITVCMLVSLLPSAVFSAAAGTVFTYGNFNYMVNTDTSTVTLTSIAAERLTGEVAVPSQVSDGTNTYTVSQLGDAFKNQGTKTNEMTGLTLPDTITKFTGTATFYGCKALKTIHLPKNLTGDGQGTGFLTKTFYFCAYLSNVEIPEGITKFWGTFASGCGTRTVVLKSKSQADFYGGSGTKDARAWADGTSGITIYYPYGGSAPTRAGTSFTATLQTYGAPTFTSGNFTYKINDGTNTVTLTAIAAEKLSGAVTVPATVSDGAVNYTVSQLGDAFKNQVTKTKALTSLTLPDTINKFTGTATFYGCSALTSIHLPANLTGDATGVGYLTKTFYFCSNLTSVELPVGITKCYGTFNSGSGVKTVTITGKGAVDFYAGSGTTDARAWADGTSGITIYYPADGTAPTRTSGSFTATVKKTGEEEVVSEFEVGDFKYKIIEGTENVTVLGFSSASNKSGEKILPDSVTFQDVTYTVISVGYAAFANQANLTSFVMADTVTTVGSNIFYGCKNLSYVHLSESLTNASSSYQLVGTFYGCTSLKTILIPSGIRTLSKTFVSSGIENVILKAKFTEIPGKEYVPFSNLETVNVFYSSDATIGGTSSALLKNTFIYDGAIAYKVKEDNTFMAVSILPGYNLSGAVTIPSAVGALNVTEICAGAFENADDLTSVIIPNSITVIGERAFADCDSLASATLSKNVQGELIGTFAGCVNLSSIAIPEGITALDGTFEGCSNLENIKFANSVSVLKNKAFYGCSKLSELAVPNTVLQITDGENEVGTVFSSGITLVVQENSEALRYADVNGINYVIKPVVEYSVKNGNAEITKTNFRIVGDYLVPDTVEIDGALYNITSIADNAFANQDALTVLTIPDSISAIGNTSFCGCDNTEFAVRVNSETSAYTAVKAANVNYIVDDDKSYLAYKKYTDKDGLEIFGTANDINLSGAVSINSFDGMNVVSIGERAFAGQGDITSITMADTITYLGNAAFADCDSLALATLSENITGTLDSTFEGCASLEVAHIPAGVTALKNTYNGCTSLTRVTIPENITAIYENSFANCKGLETVIIPNTVTHFDRIISFKDETQQEAEYVETNTSKKWVDNPFKGATNENLAICGVRGSVAEEFAYSSGIKFIDIAKEDYPLVYSDIGNKTFKVSIRDIYGKGNVTVIGALYANDGRLLECQSVLTEFNTEEYETVFKKDMAFAEYGENTTLKFMVWNNFGNLTPVNDIATVKAPEKIKIMVLGNSISNHGTSEDSGWFAPNAQGMAATSLEKDFVHVMLQKAQEKNPNVEVKIVTAWSLEANFDQWESLIASDYQDAVNYDADIIIAQFGENVKNNENEGSLGGSFDNENAFTDEIFANIVKAFMKDGKDVPVIAVTSMMGNKTDVLAAKQKACENNGWTHVNLCNDNNFAESKNGAYYLTPNQVQEGLANGTFKENVTIASGVYVHPGNNGMRAMAYGIWRYLEPIIEEMTYNN